MEKHSNIWENSSFGEQFQFWRKITIFEKNLGKILILRKIPIFGKNFFWKITIVEKHSNFWEKFQFLRKITTKWEKLEIEFIGKNSNFDKNYNFFWKNFRFLRNIPIIEENSNFGEKFQFWRNIPILKKNTNSWEKFQSLRHILIFGKIPIFEKNSYL